MYATIRTIICIIFWVAGAAYLKKNGLHKVKYFIGMTCALFAMEVILDLLPIENLFLSFDSPEAAYSYTYSIPTLVTVDGEESTLVVGINGQTETSLIVPKKSDTVWKIGRGIDTKITHYGIKNRMSANHVSATIYRYKNTKDYYIKLFLLMPGDAVVSDSRNTEFLKTERFIEAIGESYFTYYAYVKNLSAPYSVQVNGEDICLLE